MNSTAEKPRTGDVAGASAQVAQLEAAERRVKAQLETVLDKLKFLDVHHIPDSHPWLNFQRVTSIEELGEPHGTLRSALRQDISDLQAIYRQLEAELREARRQSALAAIKSREHHVEQHYHDFEHEMRGLLMRWKTTGNQPEKELEHLLGVAEKVMDEQITLLGSNPSSDNMRAVLTSMKNLSLFGKDTDKGWTALRKAADTRVRNSIHTLKSHPNRANLGKLLNSAREACLLGSETANDAAMDAAREAAVKLREAADRQFRSIPSVTNFTALVRAQHEEALLGGQGAPPDHPLGFRDAPRGTNHVLKAGDTLSQLSERYFGKACYWDVIVWRNLGLIHDPNFPPVGRTLTIA